jgi:hypothetical protein
MSRKVEKIEAGERQMKSSREKGKKEISLMRKM